MRRATAGLFVLAIAALGQARFEVGAIRGATVRVAGMVREGRQRIDPSRVELPGVTLPALIRRAYRLEPYQNVTGPDWIKRAYFDVFAKLPPGATKDQIPEMLQTLLADELKLVLRRESRLEPVCILSVGKNGPKLKSVASDVHADVAIPHSDGRTALVRRRSADGYLTYSRLNSTIILDATKITLPDLALLLAKEVNVPVLDRTALSGFYEISLFVPGEWIRAPRPMSEKQDDAGIVPVAAEPEGVNLFKSIQRLGLKLEKSKAPIQHLVVESAEQNPVGR